VACQAPNFRIQTVYFGVNLFLHCAFIVGVQLLRFLEGLDPLCLPRFSSIADLGH